MESRPKSKSGPRLGTFRNVEFARRLIGCVRVRFRAVILSVLALCFTHVARADEGGVSFWIPGLFGSLAAAPQVPGWAAAIVNLYNPVSATGNVAAARLVTINKFSATVNVSLNATLKASPDIDLVDPTYVFATPVLGGQFTVGMAGAVGRSVASINGPLTASVDGLSATRQGTLEDGRDGFSDLYPQANLRWNSGANNWMVFVMGDLPVGTYSSSNLANLGIGHGAVDSGVGYTYFNSQTGHEFSAVTGLTYNLVNTSTDYQNGLDWHLDWGASQFLTKTLQVGAVGYAYDQVTADRGCLPALCPFKSRIFGVGPQLGIIVPGTSTQTYLNFKAYWDFDTQNRASGMSSWVTLSFSPALPSAESSPPPMLTKAPTCS
ncbi:MAG: transporter [Xanthobacteraceae bacterium]